MAGANVTIDDTEIVAALARLQTKVGNLAPVYRDIGAYLLQSNTERFTAKQSPDGKDWKELSPGYQASKPKNADKILVLDNRLRGDLRYQASSQRLEVGSNLKYAATHQFGRAEANIPARPFLGLSADENTSIIAIIEEHLKKAL